MSHTFWEDLYLASIICFRRKQATAPQLVENVGNYAQNTANLLYGLY